MIMPRNIENIITMYREHGSIMHYMSGLRKFCGKLINLLRIYILDKNSELYFY